MIGSVLVAALVSVSLIVSMAAFDWWKISL